MEFKISIIVPEAQKTGHKFSEDLEPGVLATQIVSYDDKYLKDKKKPAFVIGLADCANDLMRKTVTYDIEEL